MLTLRNKTLIQFHTIILQLFKQKYEAFVRFHEINAIVNPHYQ